MIGWEGILNNGKNSLSEGLVIDQHLAFVGKGTIISVH